MPAQAERDGGGVAVSHSQVLRWRGVGGSTTPRPLYARKRTGTHRTCGHASAGRERWRGHSSKPFANSALEGCRWSAPRPGHFTPWKEPVPIVHAVGWASEPIWTDTENFTPTGIRSLDRPNRSESIYRLSHPVRHCKGVCTYYFITCLVLSDCTYLNMCSLQRLHDHSYQCVCSRASQSARGILTASLSGKELVKPVGARRPNGQTMWLSDVQWLGHESSEFCCYLSHIFSRVSHAALRSCTPVSRFQPVSVVGANSHKIYVLINMSRNMDSYIWDETRKFWLFFLFKAPWCILCFK